MPQSLLTGQQKEKPTYRVWCLYSSFVHEVRGLSHQWVQLYIGAQINYWDLTLYLTMAPIKHKTVVSIVSIRLPVSVYLEMSALALMYYRGPGFLAVAWFVSFPHPFLTPLPSTTCLSFSDFLCVAGLVLYKSFSNLCCTLNIIKVSIDF